MKKQILMTALLLFLLTAGCGDKSSDLAATPGVHSNGGGASLDGKSVRDLLETKYNYYVLACSVWIQDGPRVDLSRRPSDEFRLDIKRDGQALNKRLHLQGRSREAGVAAFVQIDGAQVVNGSVGPLANGRFLQLRNSVALEVSTSHRLSVMSRGGSSDIKTGGLPRALWYERVPVILENSVERVLDGRGSVTMVATYMACQIESQLAPRFRDDYRDHERRR